MFMFLGKKRIFKANYLLPVVRYLSFDFVVVARFSLAYDLKSPDTTFLQISN